jgi:hypothetical protein
MCCCISRPLHAEDYSSSLFLVEGVGMVPKRLTTRSFDLVTRSGGQRGVGPVFILETLRAQLASG